jgi:murein DD-endopeptidase MepM/ murein hydrolase activator NlpD
MAITLKSVFQTAANNIVSSASRSKGSLGTVKKEYNDIVRFLDLQKNQIESIKLPDKKKISQLANINIASTFGAPGNLLGSLLGGGLDLAGFVGEMFPSKGKPGKAQPAAKSPPVKVKGDKLRFGGIKALGVLNSVFAGLDFYQGMQEGEGVGKAAAGAGASLAGSIVGGVLGSALGPLGTFAGASLGGMAGGWLGDRAYEGVTGTGSKDGVKQKLERKIKAQEAAQKASVQGGNFEDIITRFSSAVSKFEKGVASGLFGTLGQQSMETEENPYDEPSTYPNPPGSTDETYDGPISGDTFFPLPGGDVGTRGRVSSNQAFGAPRDGGKRSHQGLDMTHHQGALDAPVVAYKSGKVVWASTSGSYESGMMIDHGGGIRTRYFHITPMVKSGDTVYGGQQIAKLFPAGGNTHLHFEVHKNGTPTDPLTSGVKSAQKISAPLSRDKAKEISEKSSGITAPPKSEADGLSIYPQKKPEEFFKGTPQENIFKDAKLKEEFSGKATNPEVKAAQNKYNEYVNQIKQQRTQQVSAQPAQMVAPAAPVPIPQIQQYPSYSQSQSYIIDRPSIIAMGGGGGSSQPVYIPVGGGNGGGTSLPSGPSEGQVVNSLIKTLLLTNLSAS